MVLSVGAAAAQYSDRIQTMLGYGIHPPFMGHVNGMHPRRVLDVGYDPSSQRRGSSGRRAAREPRWSVQVTSVHAARRDVSLVGAPTSAGAYGPGQERSPAVFRRHGLVELLRSRGLRRARPRRCGRRELATR